jgi:hypothetical protein
LIRGTTVGGNVQVKETAGLPGFPSAQNLFCGTRIGGNLKIEEDAIRSDIGGGFSCPFLGGSNTVGGNVKVEDNTSAFGPTTIVGNSIGGNLRCKDNSPAPVGSSNTVAGNKEDQCAGF